MPMYTSREWLIYKSITLYSFPPGALMGPAGCFPSSSCFEMNCSCWVRLSSGWAGQENPAMAHAEPHLADGTSCSSIPSLGTLHRVLTTNTSWRSLPSYEHSRAGSYCCRRQRLFSPLPSLPTQTRSRLLYTGSWMILHFLGSVVLWGHRSLLAEITFKHKKPSTCKTQSVAGWKQPAAELSPLCSSSCPSLPPGFSSQREIWAFHFYCRPQLIWPFYKIFLHLNRHNIRILFSRTTINCQPSLLVCIFCPCLMGIFLVFTVFHSSLIIPAFSYHFLPVPINNLPNYISYPLHIEIKWGLRIQKKVIEITGRLIITLSFGV